MRPPSARKIDLGYSHFYDLRERGLMFVDKSLLVQHVLEASHTGMLIPRPRRFGKTLNMSMLKDFFAISPIDMTPYFEDLLIWQVPEARRHFQKYPVISLSFVGCKGRTWLEAWEAIRAELVMALSAHKAILTTPDILNDEDASWYRSALDKAQSPQEYGLLLQVLSAGLSRLHGTPVVILIDEYDTPIHNALEHGFYNEAVTFFKRFLGKGFKDNPHLFRGVITGILRVSKENMFSDLNNVGVFSLLHEHFKGDFGFTEAEVRGVLDEQGCPELMPALERMYDGYLFGSVAPVEIYNPWSTLSCIADPNHLLIPHWHKSGSPELLHRLVLQHGPNIHADLRTLLAGETLQKQVSEHINLTTLRQDDAELFGFMLFAGYLKAVQAAQDGLYWKVRLGLVNGELKFILDQLYQDWLKQTLGASGTQTLVQAVLEGDVETFQGQLEQLLRHYTSFMDGAGATPEHFYQGLMLGLMVLLKEDFTVLSNLEAGRGRADLQLIPKASGRPGVVMELKVVRKKDSGSGLLESVLEALTQLTEKQYSTLLEAQQVSPIHRYGVAFTGKEVRVATPAQRPALEQALERALEQAKAAALQKQAGGGTKSRRKSTPPASVLSLEERLDLEDLVLPHLTPSELERMWLRLTFPGAEFPRDTLLLQWEHLLTRAILSGQLPALATLLVRQLPALKDHALLAKLRG